MIEQVIFWAMIICGEAIIFSDGKCFTKLAEKLRSLGHVSHGHKQMA